MREQMNAVKLRRYHSSVLTQPTPMTDELPSKTQRKREMHELQALGAELTELNDEQLSSMHLPEHLMDAVLDARRMSKHEARRRQLQFIGKLMRTVDPG